jgi:hypothetical protein
MAWLDATDANNLLAATFQVTAYPSITSIKLRLGTTIGTATSNMTELTGTGYTAGGTACAFGTPASQSIANTGTPSWTNGSGSSWSIEGLEPWDTAGTPKRHGFGSWTGQPISVPNGDTFAVAAGAITASLA